MKQVSFVVDKFDEIISKINMVKNLPQYENASGVLAIISMGELSRSKADSLCKILKEQMPLVRIVGATSDSCVSDSEFYRGKIQVTFMIFASSRVEVYSYDVTGISEDEAISDFSKKVNDDKEAVCALAFPTVMSWPNQQYFFDNLDVHNEDFVCIGASAGGSWENSASDMFAIGDGCIIDSGVSIAVISGSDVHARVSSNLGWISAGRPHVITKTGDDFCIKEVDNMPAARFYEKYLDIELNEDFLQNIMDFPFLIRRNGQIMAKSPLRVNEDGSIFFPLNVEEGEEIYLSYGSVRRILQNDDILSKHMKEFCGEGIFLSICEARSSYMGDEIQQEIDYYYQAAANVSGIGAYGEIYKSSKKFNSFNYYLVALSIREGEPKEQIPSPNHVVTKKSNSLVPIMDRLHTFIQESTREFAELNEKEKEMELLNAIHVERAANEAKTTFLSHMSHEIRTPIHAIMGMNEMILREAKDKYILDYAQDIKRASASLLALVNDVLDFSRIEAGKIQIYESKYSLYDLLHEVTSVEKIRAKDKKLQFNISISEDIPEFLMGDASRIRQVLINIIENAVKYTDRGAVALDVELVESDGKTASVKFIVRDTGIGIKEEDIDIMFNPFERVDEGRATNANGTGLGLPITKELVTLMGGELEVRSRYGKGSMFYFTLTQIIAGEGVIGNFDKRIIEERLNSRDKHTGKFVAPKANVLIVDDVPMNLVVTRNLLKRTLVNCDIVTSGQESIDKASSKRYDLILMDQRMPIMNGTEAMRAIKMLPDDNPSKDVPIVVLTADAADGMREKFISDGFDDYLMKPVDFDELENVMIKYLPDELVKLEA